MNVKSTRLYRWMVIRYCLGSAARLRLLPRIELTFDDEKLDELLRTFGYTPVNRLRESQDRMEKARLAGQCPRPPINAEYVLYLVLRKEEREVVIGDLLEGYGQVNQRFNKRRADVWFYKNVFGSLLPLLRRAVLRMGLWYRWAGSCGD